VKILRLIALLLCCSSFSFAVNKDLVQLQRDLEDKLNAMQNDLDTKLAGLTGMVTAMQADTRRTADQVATMQDTIGNNVAKSLTPVAGLGAKVDTVNDDVRSLKDALADLSGRLERMDAKMTDLKNQLQIMQNPPAAPSNTAPGAMPPGSTPPPGSTAMPPMAGATPANGQYIAPGPVAPVGMSADKSFTDALRDLQTGKTDLAYNEFQQYITYFPNTEYAANSQYYIGEIDYNRGNYTGAVKAFDAVLERYPNNPKTSDAHLMKAYALLKSNQRNKAVQEFRVLVAKYPNSDNSRKALQQLRSLGVSAATAQR
jgi:tol-pal system protein YbgF